MHCNPIKPRYCELNQLSGRYALSLRAGEVRSQVESQTGRHVGAWEDESDYNPDRGYNIPPRSRNPVILRGGGGVGDVYNQASEQDRQENENNASASRSAKSDSSELRMECMQWGLVPHWMKRQPDHASTLKTINARDDTIMYVTTAASRLAILTRCLLTGKADRCGRASEEGEDALLSQKASMNGSRRATIVFRIT